MFEKIGRMGCFLFRSILGKSAKGTLEDGYMLNTLCKDRLVLGMRFRIQFLLLTTQNTTQMACRFQANSLLL